MKKTEPPRNKTVENSPDKYETVETHPAYGMIGISRVTGHRKLFGSALAAHEGWISLTIRPCRRNHHLHQDWYHGDEPLIEINMSQAQFAEFITTPNTGFGVPCTINRLNNKDVPGISEEAQTEAETITNNFADDQAKIVETLKKDVADAYAILGKKGAINKAERKALRTILDHILMEVECNRPFVIEQFQRAALKVVAAGKAEIESFTTGALLKLGLTKLSELHQLAAGKTKKLEK